jgi:hypothetical protein
VLERLAQGCQRRFVHKGSSSCCSRLREGRKRARRRRI